MVCGKKCGWKPTEDFILGSSAPVDLAAKISAVFRELSFKVFCAYVWKKDFCYLLFFDGL